MIPTETRQELYVTVENESVSVAITPSVVDGVIVAGAAPKPNDDTIIFESYDPVGGVIYAKTIDGKQLIFSGVRTSTSDIPDQVSYGIGAPTQPPVNSNGIYINLADNSFWSWGGGGPLASSDQVTYGTGEPVFTPNNPNMIYISTDDNSIWAWSA
jgi:hypothetical protein